MLKHIPVAPHAGAWIEIGAYKGFLNLWGGRTSRRCVDWNTKEFLKMETSNVAPHAGAWIEILLNVFCLLMLMSHLTQVRGLKL